MLRGIDPLRAMATRSPSSTPTTRPSPTPAASSALPGADATKALRVILTLLPLDTLVDCAAHCMAVVGDPDRTEPIMLESQSLIDEIAAEDVALGRLERFAFYARVKDAFAVVATSERRFC